MNYKNVFAILFCVLLASSGCSESEDRVIERARRGDKDAMLRASEIADRQGRAFYSSEWLLAAAVGGSQEAISRLENRSANGCEYSIFALGNFYDEIGEEEKAEEMTFQLACKHPGKYAFVGGIHFLFERSGSIDKDRGKRCLVLAAENDTPGIYRFLVELAKDGIVTAESDNEVALWRRLGKRATDKDLEMLGIGLHGWRIEQLRKYQEKWPAPPIPE